MHTFVQLDCTNVLDFADLYGTVFNAPPWNDGWSCEAVSERLLTFASFPRFGGLGLVRDGRAEALALGWGERWINGWTFHLKEVCVATARQRQGLGVALVLALESQLREQGFVSVYLQTARSAPALCFYQRLGYAESGLAALQKRL